MSIEKGGNATSRPAITQPLKWHCPGGKHYLADWIIGHMPAHTHYVEPYAGGLSVLLRKSPEDVSEVVNDIDCLLSNFWEVLQDRRDFKEFARRVQATPFSDGLFENAKERCELARRVPVHESTVDMAVAFFIVARQSRQGLMKDFATLSRTRTRRGMNEQASSWLTAIEGLPDVHARLKRVVILNRDALDVIRQQDGPDTLFYLDPPYLHETRVTTKDYQHEMSVGEHDALLSTLAKIKGKFLLSGYPSAIYNSHAEAHGWRRVDRDIDNKASSAKTKQAKTECLWMNYSANDMAGGAP